MSESPNNSPTDDTDREPIEPAPGRFPPGCLMAILLAPVVYLLSPAPVAWLLYKLAEPDHFLWSSFRFVYTPIVYLILYSESAQTFYRWYFSLFGLDA